MPLRFSTWLKHYPYVPVDWFMHTCLDITIWFDLMFCFLGFILVLRVFFPPLLFSSNCWIVWFYLLSAYNVLFILLYLLYSLFEIIYLNPSETRFQCGDYTPHEYTPHMIYLSNENYSFFPNQPGYIPSTD